MAKTVKKPSKSSGATRRSGKPVGRSAHSGRFTDLHTVNADSKTFASDLGKAFRSNVQAVLRRKK